MRSLVSVFLLIVSSAVAADTTRKMDVWPGGGIFAQVVDSSEWRTTFQITNGDTRTVYVGLIFFDDLGEMLRLPFSGSTAASIGFTLEPNRTQVLSTDGTGALKQGWALVMTCDSRCSDAASKIIEAKIAAAAVFRQTVRGRQDSEAVVPMDVPDAPVMILFDNRSGYSTGVALLNPAPLVAATYSIRVIDNMGVTLREESLSIPPLQKRVFVLTERYPNSAGTFGHVLITGSSVVAMGLRFNPNGSFTSSHAVTFVRQ